MVFYHPNKIIAHEEISNWVSINGDFSQISDSTAPKTSSIQIPPHFINKNFVPLEDIQFSVNIDEIRKKYDENIDLVDWVFSDGKRFRGNNITTNFFQGSYFLNISFLSNNEVIESEDISFNVGESPVLSQILVNGESIDYSTLFIQRAETYEFSLTETKEGYLYQWDLGDGKTYYGDKVQANFGSANLPLFIALRTFSEGGVYSDQFIRIDSEDSQIFKVQTPPVKINENNDFTNQDPLFVNSRNALIFSTIFFLIVILLKISIRGVKRR